MNEREYINAVLDEILDEIKEEIKDNTYFINETTEKEGIDYETVEKIIDKYKAESEIHCNCTDAEIAKSFIEDVEAVKELLPQDESEDTE